MNLLRWLSRGPVRVVLRSLLFLFLAWWVLDRLIYGITETLWFGAAGFSELWWGRISTQALLFVGFALPAWLLAVPCLKVAAHPLAPGDFGGNGALPGAASRLEPLRRLAPRLAMTVAVVVPLFLALGQASHWLEFRLMLAGGPWGYAEPHTRLDAGLWVFYLPFFASWVSAWSHYTLVMLALVALCGSLRALPLLLTRRPVAPAHLLRSLWVLAAAVFFWKALEWCVLALTSGVHVAVDGPEWWIRFGVSVAGAAASLALAGHFLRQGVRKRAGFSRRLAVITLLVMLVPGLASSVLSPLARLRSPVHEEARSTAAHAAWGPVQMDSLPPLVQNPWPVWSATHLLQANPGGGFQGPRAVTWQGAHIFWQEGWKGLLAGTPSAASIWSDPREVAPSNALSLREQDLERQSEGRPPSRELSSGQPLPVFGLPGKHLLAGVDGEQVPAQSTGVAFSNGFLRGLWAWRLREPLLLFEARGARELLVFRGAEERARRLFPFLTPLGSPRPVVHRGSAHWTLDLATATAYFPGVPGVPRGPLAGKNAARASVKMLVDARTGEATLLEVAGREKDPLLAAWQRAFPGLVQEMAPEHQGQVARGFPPAMLEARAWEESRFLRVETTPREPYLLRGPSGPLTATWIKGRGTEFSWLAASEDGVLHLARGHGALDALQAQLDTELPPLNSRWKEDEYELEAPPQPVLWPDATAEGGWLVARALYAVPEGALPVTLTTGKGRKLWRVAVADLGSVSSPQGESSPSRPPGAVGVGETLAEALADRRRRLGPERPQGPDTGGNVLVLRALAANEAAQRHFRAGEFGAMGRELEAQNLWLRELAGRSTPAPGLALPKNSVAKGPVVPGDPER